jgi:hypothetical protein
MLVSVVATVFILVSPLTAAGTPQTPDEEIAALRPI